MKEIFSNWTGETTNSWICDDHLFIVQRLINDEFNIIPNTNDVSIIGHIDFSKLYFNSRQEAFDEVVKLKLKIYKK